GSSAAPKFLVVVLAVLNPDLPDPPVSAIQIETAMVSKINAQGACEHKAAVQAAVTDEELVVIADGLERRYQGADGADRKPGAIVIERSACVPVLEATSTLQGVR